MQIVKKKKYSMDITNQNRIHCRQIPQVTNKIFKKLKKKKKKLTAIGRVIYGIPERRRGKEGRKLD